MKRGWDLFNEGLKISHQCFRIVRTYGGFKIFIHSAFGHYFFDYIVLYCTMRMGTRVTAVSPTTLALKNDVLQSCYLLQ